MNPATLRVLIDRALAASDAAQALLGKLRRSEDQARNHLQTLRQYRQEYEERGRNRAGESRDPVADHNYAAFLVRLQQAIDTQEQEVQARADACAAGMQEVTRCLQRQKSLEALDRRRLGAEQLVQARRDQKNTDEFARRQHDRTAAADQHDDSGQSAGRSW